VCACNLLIIWCFNCFDPSLRISEVNSVSSRISKGQGYRGFLRKRAGSSFGQKKSNLRRTRKNLKKIFFKGQGAPWEEKGHKGALLKMPRRNTRSNDFFCQLVDVQCHILCWCWYLIAVTILMPEYAFLFQTNW
jgi:hypothetical protein